MYSYKYPHPAVTVDCVVFGLASDSSDLNVLLIQRDLDPFRGRWALPGGFVRMDEDLEAAARRELAEETGVADLYIEQLAAFGAPGRDPRERVITVAWLAIVNLFDHPVHASTDARSAGWFTVEDLPALAFDHASIVSAALARLRRKVREEPIVFEFLPARFTLGQVQKLVETILGASLDKRNFRKKLHSTGLLVPLEVVEMDVAHRAAQLYSLDRGRWEELRGGKPGFIL
jgi:8-oxo-dGTP diphosphatase